MKFLEKDLEQIVYDARAEELTERGLEMEYDFIFRQLNCGPYGIADLVTVKKEHNGVVRCLTITIYELKLNQVNVGSFMQAIGYFRAIERFLDGILLKNTQIFYDIVLVGQTIDDKSNFCFLTNFVNNLKVYTCNYDLDGLWFKEEDSYHKPSSDGKLLFKNQVEHLKKRWRHNILELPF